MTYTNDLQHPIKTNHSKTAAKEIHVKLHKYVSTKASHHMVTPATGTISADKSGSAVYTYIMF